MTPYYQDSAVKIYCGDCREILPHVGKFDLLLTDPPYGIDENSNKARSRGNLAPVGVKYGEFSWDKKVVEWDLMEMILGSCSRQIVFGGNYYPLPPSPCWLVWDKENGDNDFADCELAWTNLKKAVRIKRHMWNGMIRLGQEDRFHPTQKPLGVIAWAMLQAGDDVKTLLDPFAGSGTTGRAAKDLGKKATLIEREERYCEIAAKRMLQEVLL